MWPAFSTRAVRAQRQGGLRHYMEPPCRSVARVFVETPGTSSIQRVQMLLELYEDVRKRCADSWHKLHNRLTGMEYNKALWKGRHFPGGVSFCP